MMENGIQFFSPVVEEIRSGVYRMRIEHGDYPTYARDGTALGGHWDILEFEPMHYTDPRVKTLPWDYYEAKRKLEAE